MRRACLEPVRSTPRRWSYDHGETRNRTSLIEAASHTRTGLRAGQAPWPEGLDACPYRTRTMREWYYIGRAIGMLDAKAKTEK